MCQVLLSPLELLNGKEKYPMKFFADSMIVLGYSYPRYKHVRKILPLPRVGCTFPRKVLPRI